MAKAKCKHQEYRVKGKRNDLGPHRGNPYGGWFCHLKEEKEEIGPGSGICIFRDKETECPEREEG